MASRIPLVLVAGRVSQLPAGDSLNAAGISPNIVALQNNNAGTLVIGTPVYSAAAGKIDQADGTVASKSEVVGLVSDTSIAASATGNILMDDVLTATTAQWDAVVTGESGGLTFGNVYYLDPGTAGKLTSSVPSTATQFLVRVGRALSTTQLEVMIQPPIGL